MEENAKSYKELQPGTELCGGKYSIERKIGEGGFGITYKAVQAGLNRAVCIKEYFLAGGCIRDTYARTIHLQGMDEDKFERYRKAFVKEAQTLASLRHPGIVEVIDIFDENNTSYMVMPFIEGRTLQSIVENDGPLEYPVAVNYMAQIASAVGYIHERHILHRDIKPDNIIITADYKAILIDFGSAREFEEDKTQAHTSMLTHGYAPTEQYTRNSRKGSYTDIYAIGATLYFILTGQVPIEAAARITEPMPEPRELNPNLPEEANRTIMKAMQLKSQDRHQSIKEFMDDLRNVHKSQPVPKQETPEAPRAAEKAKESVVSNVADTAPKPRKKKTLPIVIAIVAVVIALSVAALFIFSNGENTSNDNQEAARKAVTEYNNLVDKCRVRIRMSGDSEPYKLLEVKKLLDDTIMAYEKKYASEMPEVYNQSPELKKALGPKLKQAAEAWAKTAFTNADAGEMDNAREYYRLSLELFDNESVRIEARSLDIDL